MCVCNANRMSLVLAKCTLVTVIGYTSFEFDLSSFRPSRPSQPQLQSMIFGREEFPRNYRNPKPHT